jgi:hypothetical protein
MIEWQISKRVLQDMRMVEAGLWYDITYYVRIERSAGYAEEHKHCEDETESHCCRRHEEESCT